MATFGDEKKKEGKTKAPIAGKGALASRFLVRPRLTEKAHAALTRNQYTFEVTLDANKGTIARSVQAAYGVKVMSVQIVRIPAKRRFFAGRIGMRKAVKKAIVTLKAGQSIELFQGA